MAVTRVWRASSWRVTSSASPLRASIINVQPRAARLRARARPRPREAPVIRTVRDVCVVIRDLLVLLPPRGGALICATRPRRVLAQAATPQSAVHHGVSKSVSQTNGYRSAQLLICHL